MKNIPSDPVRPEPRYRRGRRGGAPKSPAAARDASPGAAPAAAYPPLSPSPAAGAEAADWQGPEILERCFRELVQYYRHAGVGRACRAIAHQMNGPLQVISFLQELLEQKALAEKEILGAGPERALENLGGLVTGSLERIRHLRAELAKLQHLGRNLAYQGIHEEQREKVYLDLNQIYQQELEFYQAQPFFKHQVARDWRLGKGLPPIYGHYIDFSQSFRNLLDNALEAMAGSQPRRLTVATAYENRRRVLRIGDTGEGIPPENLPRLFTAFFSTRGPERAGLGLFMTRRLLAPYQAEFRVDSVPGETWVTVYLPND